MKKYSSVWFYVAIVFILLFSEWFFFRNILFNASMFGDRGDGRLTMLFTEHWWNFFQGKEKFSELPMFFPEKNVIGYSDMFLGFGLIHSMFRFFNFDMFVSFKYTLILIHVIGTYSMFYLCHCKLKMSILGSLFSTIAFSFSPSFSNHLGHTQLMAISFLPILMIFLFDIFFNLVNETKLKDFSVFGFIVSFVILMYNSWYVAYFCILFLTILSIVYGILLKKSNLINYKSFFAFIRPFFKLRYIIFSSIILLPFLYIYLETFISLGGYSSDFYKMCLPEIIDLVNVRFGNLLMGGIVWSMGLENRKYANEVEQGYSIVLLCLFLFLFFYFMKKIKRQIIQKNYGTLLILSIFISIAVSFLLMVRLSSNGISLWYFVTKIFPGATSIRAVARFMLWLSFPMSIITGYVFDKFIQIKYKKGIFFCLLVLLWFSNINLFGVESNWNANDEKNFIINVQTPPKDVKVFYLINSADNSYIHNYYSLDAYEIANYFSLKTINGYSGKIPNDYKLEYTENGILGASDWIQKKGLENVYVYDMGKNIWITHNQLLSEGMESIK